MFRHFFSTQPKSSASANTPLPKASSETPTKIAPPLAQEDDKVKVYVWSGDSSNVGHVAIGGLSSLSSNKSDDAGYTSIWPNRWPAFGPFAYLPLSATLSQSLADDIQAESRRFSVEYDESGERLVFSSMKAIEPDKTYVIKGLDKSKMITEYNRIKSAVASGDVCYQLYPQIKTTSREVYNCATLADHLLKTGGMNSLPKKPSWKPSIFADALEKQPNTSLKDDSVNSSAEIAGKFKMNKGQ